VAGDLTDQETGATPAQGTATSIRFVSSWRRCLPDDRFRRVATFWSSSWGGAERRLKG